MVVRTILGFRNIGAEEDGAGTVTSVSITTANGVSGTVANASTTPAITLTLGAITPTSVAIGGTAGTGFESFVAQSAPPSAPASGFKLYAESAHQFSWIGQNGFKRIFDGTANTADRTYTLPDSSGTVLLTAMVSGAITMTTAGVTSVGTINHSALTGLTSGDDHTQYALLAGRSGGQTLIGDTASGGNLTLKSTSHATKGVVQLVALATATSTATQSNSETLRLQSSTWNGSVAGPGNFTLQNVASTTVNGNMTLTLGYDTGGGSTTLATWTQGGTFTNNTTVNAQFSDTTTTPISGQFRARNTNSTVGNFAAISFMNSNATAFNVGTVGARITSHANPGSGQLVFSTANLATVTNKMCIDETGRTLIGNNITTSTAGAMLQVNGDASAITAILKMNATTPSDPLQIQDSTSAVLAKVDNTGLGTFAGLSITDAKNIALATTTGTKFGTATSQKLGFWNATPIVQPTTGVAAATFVANTSLIANDTATWDGYTIGQVVKALRNMGALA